MKNILFSLAMLFFAVSGFSQGIACTVTNNINSGTVRVDLYAAPIGSCAVSCVVSECLYPGEVKQFNPCGPDFYEWTYAVITPTTDECSTPCPNPNAVTIVSPAGCLPPVDVGFHCHANTFYVSNFVGPFTLDIN